MPKATEDLLLTVKETPLNWLVTGKKTFDKKEELYKAGGEWSKTQKAWCFKCNPLALVDKINREIEEEGQIKNQQNQERGRRAAKTRKTNLDRQKHLASEKAKLSNLLENPETRPRVEAIVKALTVDKPHFSVPFGCADKCWCGANLAWFWFVKHEENLELAQATPWNGDCPLCGYDFWK